MLAVVAPIIALVFDVYDQRRGALFYARDVLVFAACYIALDWASDIDPLGPFNITPWNPQPALAVVWTMVAGIAQWPAIMATIVLADVIVRHGPGGYAVTLGASFVLAAGYAAMGLILRSVLRSGGLQTTRELALFVITTIVGTGIVGGAFVSLLNVSGVLTVPLQDAWLRFWLGDAVGILVTAPLLLAFVDKRRREILLSLARSREAWIQCLVLFATLVLVFTAVPVGPTPRFYILFLPLIWIAMRSGMTGAIIAMAIIQVGVVVGARGTMGAQLPMVELQIVVAVLTLTGAFLGMAVDERKRTQAAGE